MMPPSLKVLFLETLGPIDLIAEYIFANKCFKLIFLFWKLEHNCIIFPFCLLPQTPPMYPLFASSLLNSRQTLLYVKILNILELVGSILVSQANDGMVCVPSPRSLF